MAVGVNIGVTAMCYTTPQAGSIIWIVTQVCYRDVFLMKIQVQISYYGREWGAVEDASAQDLGYLPCQADDVSVVNLNV
uniref:Uncharacterized protein n=1 Tax=Oryza meridionalis TaxID=40149 RepID=A0A0E0EJF5_9ORYZ